MGAVVRKPVPIRSFEGLAALRDSLPATREDVPEPKLVEVPVLKHQPTFEERKAALQARIERAEAEKAAVIQSRREEEERLNQQRAELEELERQAALAEAEAEHLAQNAHKLIFCAGEGCGELFLPAKAGRNFCEICEKKRHHPSIGAPQVRPATSGTGVGGSVFVRKPEACKVCGASHIRDESHRHRTSMCQECRKNPQNSYRYRQQGSVRPNDHVATSRQPSASERLARDYEDFYRKGKMLPPHVTHSVEIDGEFDVITLTFTVPNESEARTHSFKMKAKSFP